MTCDSWTDAVTEAAMGGAPIEPALATHLEQCAACRATLENTHALLVRIDGEVGAVLDVEPPDALVGRVRAALAERATERPQWATRRLLPVGLAAALVWSFFAGHREPSPEIRPSRPAEAVAHPPETPALGPDGIAVPGVRTEATRVPAPALHAHPTLHHAPEVLVAADQAAALRTLVEGLRQRRLDASGLLAPNRVEEPAETLSLAAQMLPDTAVLPDAPRPLEIVPLTLQPLNEEGP